MIRHFWYHANKSRVASLASRVGERRPRLRAARARTRDPRLATRDWTEACDPDGTIAKLSAVPQAEVGWFSRAIAFLTTPFKFLGISGWVDTGCSGHGRGRLIRDAQHSTDGFWTVDVTLEGFGIGARAAPYGRFLRLECEPGTEAHRVCAERRLEAEQDVRFGGPVVIDTDGPFLEIHPDRDFEIIENVAGRGLSALVETRRVTKSKVIKSQSQSAMGCGRLPVPDFWAF